MDGMCLPIPIHTFFKGMIYETFFNLNRIINEKGLLFSMSER